MTYRSFSFLRRRGTLFAVLLSLALILMPALTLLAAIDPSATALSIAQGIAVNPAIVTGASFVTRPSAAGANSTAALSDTALTFFPVQGSTYGILSTGRASGVPAGSPTPSTDLGGGNVRGNTDFDVTILKVDLNVPAGNNCLAFDFQFLTREFPEYIGQEFNDAFIAELDSSTWTTTGSTISAPNNFAFDPSGKPISVNSTGIASMSTANAAGTVFGATDGATSLLQAKTPITPGAHSVYFSIFDQEDRIFDSAVFLDNLAVSNVPAGECNTGAATPKANLTKAFSPTAVVTGNTSTLTFTISNTAGNPARSNLGFTDTLPGSGGAIFTGTPTTTCGAGNVSIGGSPIGTALTLANGTMSEGQASCTVTATVQGVTAGTYTNDSSRISNATGLSASSLNAVLTVQPNASLTKAFSPTSISEGNTTTLTFTITNGTGNPAQTGLGFTDTLPGSGGAIFTGTPSTTCPGGNVSIGGTPNGTALTFSGNMNVSQASCTITATVQGVTAASYVNNSSRISGVTGGLITSGVNATLTVIPPPPSLSKAFTTSPINVTGTTDVTFTITNGTGNPAQSNLGFRDVLPGSGGARFVAGSGATTCSTGTVTIGGASNTQLDFTGGTMTAGMASCTVTATVQGFTAGSYLNNSSRISNVTGNLITSGVNATLVVNEPRVTLTKAFSPTTVTMGANSTLTFTLTNGTGNPAQTGLGFTDTLPGSGQILFTGTPTTTCPAGTLVIGGTPNGTELTFSGGAMNAGQTTCTITATVSTSVPGTYTNDTTRVTGETSNLLDNTNATLTVNPTAPQLTKAFSPSSINVGGTSTLTFTITNGAGNPAQTGLAFRDTLPGSGGALVFLSSPAPSHTCTSASLALSSVSGHQTRLTATGISMAAGMASCTITATVTATVKNTYVNNTSNIDQLGGGLNGSGVDASIIVQEPRPALTKAFSPTSIDAGNTSTLTFTITNGDGNPAQSNLGFTDTLPGSGGALFIGTPTTTCPTGSLAIGGTPNGLTLTFSGGSLNAGQTSCTITATVQGVNPGSYVNNSGRISAVSGGLLTSGVNATLTVNSLTATLTKAFSPTTVTAGNTSTLTFTITNGTGNTAKTGMAFTDTLPGGGNVVFTGTPTSTCNSPTITFSPDNTALTFGGNLNAGQASCTVTATVRGVRSGTYVNDTTRISDLSSNLVNNVNSTLTVTAANAALTKAFSPSTINVGVSTTLIFTITNGSGNEAKAGLAFTDTLPGSGGAIFTGTPTTNCPSGTLAIGGSPAGTALTFSGGSLADGQASCTVTATVQGVARGTYVNNSGRISGASANLTTSGVNATLIVNEPRPALTKAFSPTTIPVGLTSTLTFTITNGDGNEAQSNLGFTDTLPGSGGAIFTGTPTTTCGAGNVSIGGTPNGTALTLSGGTLNAGQTSCTITATVQGVTAGSYVNNSGQISGVTGGLITSGVNATLTVNPNATLTKAFAASPISIGATTTLTFTIANGTGNPAQSSLGFTDTLPGNGGVLFAGVPSTTCTGGTVSLGSNNQAITLSGASLSAGQASCTLTATVEGAAIGSYVNDSSRITNLSGGLTASGVNATLVVFDTRPTMTKAFNPTPIFVGQTSTLTFTIANGSGNPAQSNLGFTDTLPGSGGILYTGTPTTTCSAGTLSIGGTPNGTALTFSGGAMNAGLTSCTITVSVLGVEAGTYLNDNRQVTAVSGSLITRAVNATLVVNNGAALTKKFVRATIGAGGTSNLTFTLTNNIPGTPAISGLSFTDTLPANVTVNGTPSSPQCGGTVSGSGNVITITNAALAAGQASCNITVQVTSSVIGVYPNTSANISGVTGGIDTTGVNATLRVVVNAQLTKVFNPAVINTGATSVLTFTITNGTGNPARTDMDFTDTLPANVTVSGTPATPQCGGEVTGSGNVISVTNAAMSAGQQTCTISVTVTSNVAGTYPNTSTNISNLSGALLAGNVNATLEVVGQPVLTKAFSPTSVVAGNNSTLTFTITNEAGNPSQANLGFTDTLPGSGGAIFTGTPTTTCGAGNVSIGGGGTTLTLANGSLTAGQASCTVTATVQGVTVGSYVNNAARISGITGGLQNQVDATLTVTETTSLVKKFVRATIGAGGTSTLTFTINNNTPGAGAVSGLSFTDTLPAAVTVNGTPVTPQCGGTVSGSGNVITFTGGALSQGQTSCDVVVPVTSSVLGVYVNNSSNFSNLSGIDASGANATLRVVTNAQLTKAFNPTSIAAGATSTLTFTITNGTGNPARTDMDFTDTLPSGLTVSGTPTSPQCGGATVVGTGNEITVTNASMTAGQQTCTIEVTVTGTTPGTYVNNSSNISNLSGALLAGNVNASLEITGGGAALSKAFVRPTIGAGGTSILTFTLTNNLPGQPQITGLGFTDTMPTQVTVVGTPTSPQCGGTVTANANVITVAGAELTAGQATCKITVTVTASEQGVYTNSSSNITGVTGGLITSGANTSLTVRVNARLTKAFAPATILIGQTSALTFTITNGTGNPAQASLGFTDTLPAQVTVSGTPTSPQCGGTVSGSGSVITFSGGSLAVGVASCTITVNVTSSTPGIYVNNSANITGLTGSLLAGTANATLTVGGPTMTAVPSPDVLVMGRVNRPIAVRVAITNTGSVGSTLTVTEITNSNPAVFTIGGLPISVAQGAAAQAFTVGCTPVVGADRTGTLTVQTNESGNPIRTFNLICRPAAQTVAVFRPSGNFFHLRYVNAGGFANASTALGLPGDLPIVGDWNGDGIQTVGVWRPSTGQFILRDSNAAGAATVYTFTFGVNGDLPVSGDWDGDGKDSIGVYRPSLGRFFLRNALSAGNPDFTLTYGTATDLPLIGDWDGDGKDTIGFYRPSNQRFYPINEMCNNCTPTVGAGVWYGLPNDLPIAGDWNADGITGLGVWRPGNQFFYLKNSPTAGGFADFAFQYGIPNDRPLAGFWAPPPPPSSAPPFSAPQGDAGADTDEGDTSSPGSAPEFKPGQ